MSFVGIPPPTVNDAMIDYLKKGKNDCVTNCVIMMQRYCRVGGADGRYRFTGGADLRPYKKGDSQFIMQGIHSTLVNHYNDTLNFVLISPNNMTTLVQVSLCA